MITFRSRDWFATCLVGSLTVLVVTLIAVFMNAAFHLQAFA